MYDCTKVGKDLVGQLLEMAHAQEKHRPSGLLKGGMSRRGRTLTFFDTEP